MIERSENGEEEEEDAAGVVEGKEAKKNSVPITPTSAEAMNKKGATSSSTPTSPVLLQKLPPQATPKKMTALSKVVSKPTDQPFKQDKKQAEQAV